MWNRFVKDEKGFTGLEAAIVLVAFVVVAAVFSYVMLGAGFYTTQKSQEVVHTGVAQASSSLAPSGDVIVTGNNDSKVKTITFYVTNTAGGSSVDLNKTIITYTDKNDFNTSDFDISISATNDGNRSWGYEVIISDDGAENLVDNGEKYKITMNLDKIMDGEGISDLPGVNENVKIEVKPPEGAVLVIQRTMPPSITDESYYAVY